MAARANYREGCNVRNKYESYFEGEHVPIEGLKSDDMKGKPIYYYLNREIIGYPPSIEFHITEVAHVTNKTSLPQIWDSEGFKGLDKDSFSWWSLNINDCDIQEAEELFLEKKFPDRSKEAKAAQQPFLKLLATSPLFINESSRYGNFRFTFPLSQLMKAYKQQSCEGEEPVLRVYQTKVFKQEIEYVVLVHSPQFNEKYQDFPLLTPKNSMVSYDGHQITWKAQGICKTHKFQLCTFEDKLEAVPTAVEYYVWDQVSFVFHTPEVLTFPKSKLKASLSCCLLDSTINLSRGENCFSIREAEKVIEMLEDDESEKEDEKEEHKSEELKIEEN